ncbi:MAG: HEAT repeat domain-containing protein, partial [Vicinamibacterales bacterium]|nr:HEAT repeat domain-containing protein [Vicinamibacterales bacterium]
MRRVLVIALPLLATACASAPPPPPVVVPFETKMSWIVRLEDQRVLRDPAPMVAPPPVQPGKKNLLPPPPSPPDLVRLLSDDEARIRRRAALAIGRVGLVDGVPQLVRLLQTDGDPEVRQMSAFALGLVGDKAAVEPLKQALTDSSPVVAGRAAEALGLIGDAGSAAAVGQLVGASVAAAAAVSPDDDGPMLNPSADAFRLGVYALARLKAYEPLATAVLGPGGESRVRWWPVAFALSRIEDPRALPALLWLARSEGVYARAFAAKGLGALKDPSAVPVLLPMVDVAQPGSGPAIEAMRALGRIGDARATPQLLAVLGARTTPPAARAEALLALGGLPPDPDTQEYFVDFLSDASPFVRAAALQALAKADDDSFMTVLSGLDPDSHWSVRAQLATVLATKDSVRALPRLMRMLSDPDQRVVAEVLGALTKLKAPDITRILVEKLQAEDVALRSAAATHLGELKPEGAVDALLAAYKRGEVDLLYDVRAAVIEALSNYGPAVGVPALRNALTDKDWAVRVRAAELLKKLDPSIDAIQAIRPAPAGRSIDYEAASLVNPPFSSRVYIETEKGTIEIELDVLNAPLTCESFVALARKGYFNGLTLHRVVPDFVVQGGDPHGDGSGGPGYTIRDELNQKTYARGTVGMALAWEDTGGSQFFITHSPQPHLDAKYTVFGRVVSGMEVVDKLTQWDVM